MDYINALFNDAMNTFYTYEMQGNFESFICVRFCSIQLGFNVHIQSKLL